MLRLEQIKPIATYIEALHHLAMEPERAEARANKDEE
jgi:hypothetical protein